jgi:hypothetical protein
MRLINGVECFGLEGFYRVEGISTFGRNFDEKRKSIHCSI